MSSEWPTHSLMSLKVMWIMNKRSSTKQQILNVLKKENVCTMKVIMENFTISEIAVRKHIHELESQGFVKSKSVKQEIGRPYLCYELTEKGHATFPNQYETLPVEILQDVEALLGEQAVEDVLKQRIDREQATLEKQLKTKNFDEQIKEIARLQCEKGYMVEYKKIREGHYEIKNYNCPILNIASSYSRICNHEKGMLENLLPNTKVISEACITEGDHCCQWTITNIDKD